MTQPTLPINIKQYDYIIDVVQSGAFQRDDKQREVILWCMAIHIADDGETTKWVHNTTLLIKKDTLSFIVKFSCVLYALDYPLH